MNYFGQFGIKNYEKIQFFGKIWKKNCQKF